jgi:hypothetical protein
VLTNADIHEVGAPIIDGMLAGFKLAEMWADLARAGVPPVSRRGFFQQPPAQEYERLRRFIGKDATPLSENGALTLTLSQKARERV